MQVVKLGPAQGENVAITDGLQPGDKVVIDGADKLRDGSQITLPARRRVQRTGGDQGDPAEK